MASYRLEIKKSAARELESIPKKDRERIVRRIQALAENPQPSGSEKLAGAGDKYRIRQGDYRILYEIANDILTVFVVKIAHRKDVYRRA